ncbi:hypothetical protein SLS56_011586 [Neofusicoccum ribis]|uniref:Kinesin light chain n=1 Tax=Neofusicoccum ribis TaxID=45134 RepID=A0ABR3SB87_9PEZI
MSYTLGQIGEHNIVVTVMPETGTNRAAQVALQLLNDFSSIRFGLLRLQAKHRREGNKISAHLGDMLQKWPNMEEEHVYQGVEQDELYEASYDYNGGPTCKNCNKSRLVDRGGLRKNDTPKIFYGTIGCGNVVIKDGADRERLREYLGVLCVEMEAAGLMDEYPCLVVRGVCDYADSHKNKRWQPYAAATAAAYMKEFLLMIPAAQVKETSKAADAINSPHRVPFSLKGIPVIEKFIGRQEDVRRIEDFFQPGKRAQPRRKVFELYGMGGIGKTQLAVEFLRTHQNDYTAIFWLDGSSEEQLEQSLVNAAFRIPQGELNVDPLAALRDSTPERRVVVKGVLQWLSVPTNTKWLLILDNVDHDYLSEPKDPGAFNIEAYFPDIDQGSILITSRLKIVRQRLRNGFEVAQTNNNDLTGILESNAARPIQDANALVQRLDGLPLALAQAGAYIGLNGMTATQYLKHYEDTWKELMENHKFSLPEYQSRTVLTTWTLSYNQVRAKSDEAAGLLRLWGMLDPSDLWFELVQAVEEVHEEIKASVYLSMGLLFSYHAELRKTERMYQQALDGYEKALGPDHTSTLDTVNNLGNLYSAQGKLKEAEEMYQRALDGSEKALGPDHTSTLDTVNNLGSLYKNQVSITQKR